jgi:ABC-type transporter Mla subunit MlaD
MNTAYQATKLVCVVALTAALLIILYRVNQTLISVNAATQQLQSSVQPLQATIQSTNKVVSNLDATITDTRRVILIAGGTLNIVRDTMRKEQSSTEAAIRSSQALVDNSNKLVSTADDTLKQLTISVNHSLEPLPLLLQQTQADLKDLEPTITELTPLAKNTSDAMEHVSGITADTQHEIHKFVYPPPQPWYDKYIINPAKIVLHMLTIPLTKG